MWGRMSKRLWANPRSVIHTCGLGVLGNFSTSAGEWCEHRQLLTAPPGGTGFFVAGFIPTSECKLAYEKLTKRYKLIYQSPVRINTNSGNQFFFCIFDRVG